MNPIFLAFLALLQPFNAEPVPTSPSPSSFAAPLPLQEEGGWSFALKPYFWAAGLEGTVGAKGAEVDAGFDDLLENLQFGGMIGFEATPADAPWSLLLDVIYLDLGESFENGDVSVTELVTEVDVAFRPSGWEQTELIGGLRYWDIESDFEVGGGSGGKDIDWVDPVLGIRGTANLSEKWGLNWRGDLGGLGVGSDFSYQLFAALTYPLGPGAKLGMGWRHIDVDYEDDGFRYDTATSGPVFGVSFEF